MDVNLPALGLVISGRKLANDTRVGFAWRGQHGRNEVYAERDIVEFKGSLYLCIQDHNQSYGALYPGNPYFWEPLVVCAQASVLLPQQG